MYRQHNSFQGGACIDAQCTPELKRTAVTESDFGVSAGGGVNIRLTDRFDLYLEGGLVIGFLPGSSTQLFPVKLGLALQ